MFKKKRTGKTGKFKQPPRLEPPKEDSFLAILRELLTYKDSPGSAPFYLAEKALARIDKSYLAIALHWIGGEGIVIKCSDEMQRRLAIKIALPHEQAVGRRDITIWDQFRKRMIVKDSNSFRERFKAGADLQRRIYKEIQREHVDFFSVPNVYKISSSPGLYIEMPWIESIGILQWFRSESKNLRYRLNKFNVLLDATHFVHERGIVHRDLKAANILIGGENGNEDSICILDWTLAREVGQERDITVPGMQMGTYPHASRKMIVDLHPEMATFVDDINALGYTLWEFVVGSLPKLLRKEDFEDEKKVDKYRKTLAKYLPDPLQPVFLQATEQQEEKRFQLVLDFRVALGKATHKIKFNEQSKLMVLENVEISDSTVISLDDEKILRDETEITELCVKEFLDEYLQKMCLGCDGVACQKQFTCRDQVRAIVDLVLAMKERKLI